MARPGTRTTTGSATSARQAPPKSPRRTVPMPVRARFRPAADQPSPGQHVSHVICRRRRPEGPRRRKAQLTVRWPHRGAGQHPVCRRALTKTAASAHRVEPGTLVRDRPMTSAGTPDSALTSGRMPGTLAHGKLTTWTGVRRPSVVLRTIARGVLVDPATPVPGAPKTRMTAWLRPTRDMGGRVLTSRISGLGGRRRAHRPGRASGRPTHASPTGLDGQLVISGQMPSARSADHMMVRPALICDRPDLPTAR